MKCGFSGQARHVTPNPAGPWTFCLCCKSTSRSTTAHFAQGVGTEAVAVAGGGLSSSEPMDIVWSDGGLPLLSRILQPDSSSWWAIHIDDGCSDPASDSTWLSVLPTDPKRPTSPGTMECHGAPSAVLLDAASPINVLHIVEGDTLGAGPISLDVLAGNTFSWTLYDPQEGCSMDTNIWVPSHPPLTRCLWHFSRTGLHPLGCTTHPFH